MAVFLKAHSRFVYGYIGMFVLIISVLVGSVGKPEMYRRIVSRRWRLFANRQGAVASKTRILSSEV
jgi:hypothetical protein